MPAPLAADPTGGWVALGSQVLGGALKTAAGDGPSRAESTGYASLDGSMWSVNFGKGGTASVAPGIPSWVILGAAALGVGAVLFKAMK